MTLEEYNIRTNTKTSPEEFQFINRAYMAAGDSIDKEQFCKDVKSITPTIAALTERVERAQVVIKGKDATINALVEFIAEQAEKCSSSELRAKAIQMMGEKEYISWKIGNSKTLWKADLELIHDLINL